MDLNLEVSETKTKIVHANKIESIIVFIKQICELILLSNYPYVDVFTIVS